MFGFRLVLTGIQRKALDNRLRSAERRGDIRTIKRILAILSVVAGHYVEDIAATLQVSAVAIRGWVKKFILEGVKGLEERRSPGRPAKLTKKQRRELAKWIDLGPEKLGFSGACWRTPMIQHLIMERFNVFYSVNYLSQLLKNMGDSYQKAKFVSDHHDPDKRAAWLREKWPKIIQLAKEKGAHVLFGDEASYPQWGTLTYTWAKQGEQPTVKTSGKRKAYKVFGLIDYFTGGFWGKGHEGKLNSESYQQFLQEVLEKTTRPIILIHDGARYHGSKSTKKFFAEHADRLMVFDLPTYSPDYNPIEKLWKKIKEKETHLHYFPTFEDLRKKVDQALANFSLAQEEVLSLFGFYRELKAA